MAEMSKTAKASMVKAPKEKKVEESTEEAIRQIRIDRQAGLAVLRFDRVDKLLAAYDAAIKQLSEVKPPDIYYDPGVRDIEEAQRSQI